VQRLDVGFRPGHALIGAAEVSAVPSKLPETLCDLRTDGLDRAGDNDGGADPALQRHASLRPRTERVKVVGCSLNRVEDIDTDVEIVPRGKPITPSCSRCQPTPQMSVQREPTGRV